MERIYLLFGVAVLTTFAWADFRGWSLNRYDEVKAVPKSIRNNPGAYRGMYGHSYFHK